MKVFRPTGSDDEAKRLALSWGFPLKTSHDCMCFCKISVRSKNMFGKGTQWAKDTFMFYTVKGYPRGRIIVHRS